MDPIAKEDLVRDLEELIDADELPLIIQTLVDICSHKADHHGSMHTPGNNYEALMWRRRTEWFQTVLIKETRYYG